MTRLLPPILALALLTAGCNGPVAPVVKGTPKPKASAPVGTKASPGAVKPIPLEAERRPVGLGGVVVTLTGKAKLLSDQGAGVISNNSGGIISDNGGGLIGNNAGGLISDKGGQLIGNNSGGYRLAQAGQAENALADADVELLDGRGRLLVDDKGRPLGARTDATGAFTFTGELPPEALVARVRLWQGGVLMAMLPPRQAGAVALDLDTSSTLGAAYVLEKFVQKRQDVYDRLPAAEADGLRRDVEAARGSLDATPSYAPASLAATTEALKAKVPAVDQRLERIRAILLVGQADAGNGRKATEVALSFPMAIADGGGGAILVGEFGGGRVRRIDAAGTIGRYIGGGTANRSDGPIAEASIDSPAGMATGADGTVYVADELGSRVLAIKDGVSTIVAGTGVRGEGGPAEGPATALALNRPVSLAVAPDGTLYIGENTRSRDGAGRLLRRDPDGTIHAETLPAANPEVPGVAVATDGALWFVDGSEGDVWRRPKGGEWARLAAKRRCDNYARMIALPDGRVAVSEDEGGRVLAFDAAGAVTVLGGDGVAGYQGDGGPASAARFSGPCGLLPGPDGSLLVADSGNAVIRKLAAPLDGSGRITTIAGTFGVAQQGDALSIAINTPGGMARDAQGRLIFSEGGSHTVKRLEDGRLTLLAGTTGGFSGDGGPATAAQLSGPTGVAVIGDALYVLDAFNVRIRKIDGTGTISTVVGSGSRGEMLPGPRPATGVPGRQMITCVAGPDGRLYWTDAENSQVCRLNLDGTAELIAGADWHGGYGGDGGPAIKAVLNQPAGLAFDSRGDLYVSDAANMCIRKITGLAGADPQIEAFAGIPGLGALFEGRDQAGEVAASEAIILAPSGLAFGPDDALYVGELGTGRLKTVLGARGLAIADLPASPSRIRRITGIREGKPVVKIVAGPGTGILAEPGTDDSLVLPVGLIVDPQRGLYVMDTGNNAIRLIPKALL